MKMSSLRILGPAPLQEVLGIFVVCEFWRVLPGIFLDDFSGQFCFPHNNEEPKSADKKTAKKSGGSKIKLCQEPAPRILRNCERILRTPEIPKGPKD